MTAIRLSDAQIAQALRAHLPASAPAGILDRVRDDAASVRQRRRLPMGLIPFDQVDPATRRRIVLLAAVLMLTLALAVAAAVGALLERRGEPIPDLSIAPPTDLPAFARSAYEAMPRVEPLTLTAVTNGTTKTRLFVDRSGAIRIETFASVEAVEPDGFKIYSGTSLGELTTIGSRKAWYEQQDAISEDPRVFLFATLGDSRGAGPPGCEVAISEGEAYASQPARGWQYVGLETIAGRPTHHIHCGDGDLWLDVESRLTMRSRGPAVDASFQAVPGEFNTTEVTQIAFGQPPAELFALKAPPGVAIADAEEYQCAQDPFCGASPKPIVTPEPAPTQAAPAKRADSAAILAAVRAAYEDLPPFDVTVERWNSKYPGGEIRALHDATGRSRIELTYEASPDPPSVELFGPGYHYRTEQLADGTLVWRSPQSDERSPLAYPLLPPECEGGLVHLGVDLVLDRPADHVACKGVSPSPEFWVDRTTRLIVRFQEVPDEASGTTVYEVTRLELTDPPPSLFDLPPGVELEP